MAIPIEYPESLEGKNPRNLGEFRWFGREENTKGEVSDDWLTFSMGVLMQEGFSASQRLPRDPSEDKKTRVVWNLVKSLRYLISATLLKQLSIRRLLIPLRKGIAVYPKRTFTMWEILLSICFVIVFFLVLPLLTRPMTIPATCASFVLFCFAFSYMHFEISTPVFWILFVFLLPCLLVPLSLGSLIFLWLVFHHWHLLEFDSSLGAFWIGFVLLLAIPIPPATEVSPVFLACWVAVAYTGGSTIHHGMSYRWWFAWIWLSIVLRGALPPNTAVLWHILSLSLILILGLVTHPERSLGGFVWWTSLIFIFRLVFYPVYVAYFYSPLKYTLFPLNLFSGKWKISSPKWYPETSGGLCPRCRKITTGSKLILGSNAFLTRLVERHEFWGSMEKLWRSARQSQCHMCHLFWYSISEQRRKEFVWLSVYSAGRIQNRSSASNAASLVFKNSARVQKNTAAGLSVKIWEERPLSSYTYAQLFYGDMAIGARLLIHRNDIFETPSTAGGFASTGSDNHIEQAKLWLGECTKSHSPCKGVGNTPRRLPPRLIYVAPASPQYPTNNPTALKLNLVETKDMSCFETPYLAMSHCWGGTVNFQLRTTNYDSCLKSIDFFQLSKNMQDAVQITQGLGFSYIWIDSLCIIQDSDDFKAEGEKMGDVYSGAACTIASTGSSSSDGGFFHKRSCLSLRPCTIGVSSPDSLLPDRIYARRNDVFDFERGVDRAPLNKRAWVLQERLFSRRIIHFGAEMIYWECCRRSASELNPKGYVFKRYPEDFTDYYAPKFQGIETRTDLERAERASRGLMWVGPETSSLHPSLVEHDPDAPPASDKIWERKRGFWKQVRKHSTDAWVNDSNSVHRSGFRAAFERLCSDPFEWDQPVGMESFSHHWYEIVETYTRCQMTQSNDKFFAISGIVGEIKRTTGYTYLAGLWKEHLLTNLLWFAAEGPGRRLLEPQRKSTGDSTSTPVKEAATHMPAEGGEGVTTSEGEACPERTETSDFIIENDAARALPGHDLVTQLVVALEPGVCMAPTWSWGSIDGTVTLDILPGNSGRAISVKKILVSDLSATVDALRPDQKNNPSAALVGELHATGPLCAVSVTSEPGGTVYNITNKNGHKPAARCFPDVCDNDICGAPELFCLSCLVLSREITGGFFSEQEEVQGLVLRRRERREHAPDVFERVGFFNTSRMSNGPASTKRFRTAAEEVVYIV